jgi:hypothetical protein
MKSKWGSFLAALGRTTSKALVITIIAVFVIVGGGTFAHWMISKSHHSARLHRPRFTGRQSTKGYRQASDPSSRSMLQDAKFQDVSASNPCPAPPVTGQVQTGDGQTRKTPVLLPIEKQDGGFQFLREQP